MPEFLADSERPVASAISGLSDANPFLEQRIELERQALGRAFVDAGEVWRVEATTGGLNPNLDGLTRVASELVPKLRDRLAAGATASESDLRIYEGVVRYLLYQRYQDDWMELIRRGEEGRSATSALPLWRRVKGDVDRFLGIPDRRFPFEVDAAQLMAWGFQIRRAFHHTFRRIYGASLPAARLRGQVWQSIFTHDTRRYRAGLFTRMADVPTLIVGESGTGKELVARAIGLSRFVPFDPERGAFTVDFAKLFHPLNIAALPATLVESELFGHKRGAFTGALADRVGWLETCDEHGTVFLDEIGELPAEIQIKLLRVLETRGYNRLGETNERRFAGKIMAATNRDLALEMQQGRFREDVYYRLCADVIETPTLRAQLRDTPDDLANLVIVSAARVVGLEEASALAAEVQAFVEAELGGDYAWPGNVRELEQCVRSVLVRGSYAPTRSAPPDAHDPFAAARAGELTADELLRRYCTLVYAKVGSYEGAARQLGLDRRTVRAKIDEEWLGRLR